MPATLKPHILRHEVGDRLILLLRSTRLWVSITNPVFATFRIVLCQSLITDRAVKDCYKQRSQLRNCATATRKLINNRTRPGIECRFRAAFGAETSHQSSGPTCIAIRQAIPGRSLTSSSQPHSPTKHCSVTGQINRRVIYYRWRTRADIEGSFAMASGF